MEQYIQKLIVSWEKYMLYDCYCRIIINKTHYYMFSLARELVQGADQEPDRQAQAGKQAGKQASRQASKQAGKQASKQASRQASKQASK